MSTMDWDQVDPRPQGGTLAGGGKSKFLSLKAGMVYKIRPVGKPKMILKYFVPGGGPNGRGRGAITDKAGDSCVIMRKYRDAEGNPLHPQRTRYAFNCIDRADGQLKIVEVPVTVARYIRDWGVENGVNPGSGKGVDFTIKVVRKGSDPRNTTYDCIPTMQTPFSEDEKQLLEKQGVYDLDEVFKPIPQDEIEDHLSLTEGSATVGATKSSSDEEFVPKTQKSSAPKSASGGDEDFNF